MFLYLLSCQTIPSEAQKFTEQVVGTTGEDGEAFVMEAEIIPTTSQDGFHILARYVNEYHSTIGGVREIGIDIYDVDSLSLLMHLDLQTDAFGYVIETIMPVSDIFPDPTLHGYASVYIGISDDTNENSQSGESESGESEDRDSGKNEENDNEQDNREDSNTGGIDSLTKIYYAPSSFDTLLSTTHHLPGKTSLPLLF